MKIEMQEINKKMFSPKSILGKKGNNLYLY